jgi:hypothetical protein
MYPGRALFCEQKRQSVFAPNQLFIERSHRAGGAIVRRGT